MLITPTIERLRDLSLTGMARALAEQMERPDYQALSFEDRLGLLIDREAQDRENRRLDRNLRSAKLRAPASIEDLDFHRPRGLDRSLVLSLADAQWVSAHRNILIAGPTGSGKTYVACALAHATLRRGHTALYLRAPRMLGDLALARADGRLPRLMASWAKVDVVILDDLALRPLSPEQAADLLEVIEDRHQLRSTIVTSQLPVGHWHDSFGEPTIADAILDRLVHNAFRIELRGDSLRRPQPDGDHALEEGVRDGNAASMPKTATHSGKRPATTPWVQGIVATPSSSVRCSDARTCRTFETGQERVLAIDRSWRADGSCGDGGGSVEDRQYSLVQPSWRHDAHRTPRPIRAVPVDH